MIRSPLVEWIVSLALVAGAAAFGVTGWQWYDREIRPTARTVPTVTPTPFIDPVVARDAARRSRQVLDHVGAGIAMRQANPRAAVEEFMKALALDPGNVDARQSLREMGVDPPPGSVVTATVPRPTPFPTFTPSLRA